MRHMAAEARCGTIGPGLSRKIRQLRANQGGGHREQRSGRLAWGEDSGDQDGPLGQSRGKRPLATLFSRSLKIGNFILDVYWEWAIMELLMDYEKILSSLFVPLSFSLCGNKDLSLLCRNPGFCLLYSNWSTHYTVEWP